MTLDRRRPDRTPIDPLLVASRQRRRRDIGLDAPATVGRVARTWFRRQVAGAVLVLTVGCLLVGAFADSAASDEVGPSPEPSSTAASDVSGRSSGMATLTAVGDPAPQQVLDIIARYEVDGRRWPDPGCVWLEPLIADHGLPPWMLAVAWRESRCRADAHNGDRSTGDDSWGVFQINALGPTLRAELSRTCGVVDPATLLDPETSVRCAAALYARYGYRPWNAGRYFR